MKKSLFSACVVGLGLTVNLWAQVPNYVPTNGLVGYWPFNGNANDESGNGNNGTVNGATLTTDRFGNTGKAYDFDGSNKINLGRLSIIDTLNATKDISYSLWIKADQNQSQFNFMPLLSKRQEPWQSAGNAQSYFTIHGGGEFYYPRNNKYICYAFVDAHMYGYGLNNGLDGGQTDDNNWHSIIATKNNNLYSLYYDGSLIDTLMDNSVLYSTDSMIVGYQGVWGFSYERWYKGTIDDIGIWNRALTDQEISDLYLSSNVGVNESNFLNEIQIYPNPTNDHITIDAGNLTTMNGYSIKIEDAQGQQVFQNAVTQQQFYIDITTWGGNGLYFVRIIDPQGNTVDIKKIVLQ
jgi:hypothetical protein